MLNLFNRQVMPSWTQGGILTAPAAAFPLITFNATFRETYIYGFFIACGEANTFKLVWKNGDGKYERLIPFASLGYAQTVDYVPLNEGMPASAKTTITIINLTVGGAGVTYQAGLLTAGVN